MFTGLETTYPGTGSYFPLVNCIENRPLPTTKVMLVPPPPRQKEHALPLPDLATYEAPHHLCPCPFYETLWGPLEWSLLAQPSPAQPCGTELSGSKDRERVTLWSANAPPAFC